jgi:hypothetical protein
MRFLKPRTNNKKAGSSDSLTICHAFYFEKLALIASLGN